MQVHPDPKPRKRLKNKKYLRDVANSPCLVSKEYAGQAHHLRHLSDCGMGLKPDDYFSIPLTPFFHDMAHNKPEEFLKLIGRLEIFGWIFHNLEAYAEDEGWDMLEIYELLVNCFIDWIATREG